MEEDMYQTVAAACNGLYKEKGSKFMAFLFPVETEEEVKELLKELKATYYDARHHCYAYRLGVHGQRFRTVDDGEPSSTAGKPILNQLLSHNITNVCVFVIRYFGGTKLGVPGLINAYKQATNLAILNAQLITKEDKVRFWVKFDYMVVNDIMKNIKDRQIEVIDQVFDLNCAIHLAIRRGYFAELNQVLLKISSVQIDCQNEY